MQYIHYNLQTIENHKKTMKSKQYYDLHESKSTKPL